MIAVPNDLSHVQRQEGEPGNLELLCLSHTRRPSRATGELGAPRPPEPCRRGHVQDALLLAREKECWPCRQRIAESAAADRQGQGLEPADDSMPQ